jgi:DNA-binding XRE family transcriptional regulator
MNAQRNRGMYLRVGERRAEIRKSRKISQAKLAKLLGIVEGTIQNYEHGRNEPNITRLYDAKRGRQPRVEYICRHSQQQIACLPVVPIGKQAQIRNVQQQIACLPVVPIGKQAQIRNVQQQIACLPVVPIGKQAQIRNVVVCHLSVGRCEYAFRLTLASGSPARCAPLPKPRISACSTFNSPKPTAVRSSCRLRSSVNCLSSLPKSALARCGLRRSRPCADARHRQTVNEWPVPTGHRVQRPVQRTCNGSNKFVSNCERPDA